MAETSDRGALFLALEQAVVALGAEDLLLFRQAGDGRLAHIDGCGRGEGWAGVVDGAEHLLTGRAPGSVERLCFAAPHQIIGPYEARHAVIVRRNDELVVLGTSAVSSMLNAPDDAFRAVASTAAAAITQVSAAKRLADELEILHAVQSLAGVDTSRPLAQVLDAVARTAAEALCCDLAVVTVPGAEPVVARTADGGPSVGECITALQTLLRQENGPACSQEALDRPLPGVSTGVRSWLLMPLNDQGDAGLLLVHGDQATRGFTAQWQELGDRIADVARTVLTTAASRSRLAEEARLLRQAVERDTLTGLGNRAAWERLLDQTTAGTGAVGVGVVVCDLDGLKTTNDRDGHEAGDGLLRAFSALLAGACPNDDVVRLGGDEFAVLVRGTREQTQTRGNAIESALLEHTDPAIAAGCASLRASVGWCWTPDPTEVRSCQRRADAAMYDAKRATRLAAVPRQPKVDRPEDPDWLASELTACFTSGDGLPTVAFQPLLDLSSGAVLGVEALARWRHPRAGDLRPDLFVAAAEQSGLVAELDDHILRTAAREVACWHREGFPIRLSFNVSATRVGAPGFASHLIDVVQSSRLSLGSLMMETTESVLAHGEDSAAAALNELSAAGMRLALDDFGCGGSTLARLALMPVDQVKIDISLLRVAAHRESGRRLLNGVVDIVHSLGLQTLLEGIELPRHLHVARNSGAELGQGFLLGRPAPSEQLAARLRAQGHFSTQIADAS